MDQGGRQAESEKEEMQEGEINIGRKNRWGEGHTHTGIHTFIHSERERERERERECVCVCVCVCVCCNWKMLTFQKRLKF